MERFIGLDGHLSSCTFCVLGSSGKRLRLDVVETNERGLVEYVRKIGGTRRLCLEEGTMSQWLYEVVLRENLSAATADAMSAEADEMKPSDHC